MYVSADGAVATNAVNLTRLTGLGGVTNGGILTRTETRVVLNSNDQVISHVVTASSGPTNLSPRTVREDVYFGSGQYDYLRTTHAYYWNPADTGSYGRLKTSLYPDGNWQQFQYDELGRVTNAYSAWLNATTSAIPAGVRQTTTAYGPGTLATGRVSERTEKLTGIVVAHTLYSNYVDGAGDLVVIEERCHSQSAVFGDSDNLSTTTVYVGNEDEKVHSVTYPDGAMDSTTYDYGTYDGTTNRSDSSFSVGAGPCLMTTVVHGTTNSPDGIALRTTKDITIENDWGEQLLSETWVCAEGGSDRLDWTFSQYDAQHRATNVWYSDGTHAETEYSGCCGLLARTDRQGSEHTYTVDSLKRVVRDRLEGVTAGDYLDTLYVYDPAGRQLAVSNRSATAAVLVSSNAYDLAGRPVISVEAGLTTTYTYGYKGTTAIQPGGATSISKVYADGQALSSTGTAVTATSYQYGVNTDGSQWTRTCTGPGGTNSVVWSKATVNMLGRTIKTENPAFYSGTVMQEFHYNGYDQLVKSTATQEADRLYEYSELGEQVLSGLDADDDGALLLAGLDRIGGNVTDYILEGGVWYRRSISMLYASADGAVVTNAVSKTRLTGLGGVTNGAVFSGESMSVDLYGNTTIEREYVDRAAKTVTRAVARAGVTNLAQTISINGLLVSATGPGGGAYTYGYDELRRSATLVDPRTGTNTTVYNDLGQVAGLQDAAGNWTHYGYAAATGRRMAMTNALGLKAYYAYDVKGRATKTWGDSVYPVQYVYDQWDRMTNMSTYRGGIGWQGSTWPANPGTADTTIWAYEARSGLLTRKMDAAGGEVSYAYFAGSRRLESRLTPATRDYSGLAGSASYAYTNTGEVVSISYGEDVYPETPPVAFTYDRLGRQQTVADGQGERTFAYDEATLQLTRETIMAGDGSGSNVITRTYDAYGRPAGVDLRPTPGASPRCSVSYFYDGLGRLATVSNRVAGLAPQVFTYAYVENSDLVRSLSTLGTSVQVVERHYEPHRNLLVGITNILSPSSWVLHSQQYENDALGRRTSLDVYSWLTSEDWTNTFAVAGRGSGARLDKRQMAVAGAIRVGP